MDWGNKEQVLEEIKNNGVQSFENVSEELKNDFGFVLRAFALDSRILPYLKDEFKSMISKATEVGIENMETDAYTTTDVLIANYGDEWEKHAKMQDRQNTRWIKRVRDNFENNFMDSTTKRYLIDFLKEVNNKGYNASFNNKSDEAIKQWEELFGWDEQFRKEIAEDIEKCEFYDTTPETAKSEEMSRIMDRTLEDTNIPIKAKDYLKKIGIQKLGDMEDKLTYSDKLYLVEELGKDEYIKIIKELGRFYEYGFSETWPGYSGDIEELTQKDIEEMYGRLIELTGEKKIRKQEVKENPIDYDMDIEKLNLSVRSFSCLKKAGINSLGDLSQQSEESLMKIKNLGKHATDEIISKLSEYGITLKEYDDDLEQWLGGEAPEVQGTAEGYSINEFGEIERKDNDLQELESLRDKKQQLLEQQRKIEETEKLVDAMENQGQKLDE